MRMYASRVDAGHPDYVALAKLRDAIARKSGGMPALLARFPELVREAVDFVLDPVRTARTRVSELDNVEKTFIGLKLEHFVRDLLDVPKGLRDLVIDGVDVDIKNTVGTNWSIPEETYRNSEACLLMAVNDAKYTCSLGLILARPDHLHKGKGNRDSKRGISASGFENILWIVQDAQFPPARFDGIDMARFREMRKTLAGNERVAQFWRENLRRVVHRDVMQTLLFDQHDYMKRLRANGGAPDILRLEGIAILLGTYLVDRTLAAELGVPGLKRDEIVAVSARTPAERDKMQRAAVIAV